MESDAGPREITVKTPLVHRTFNHIHFASQFEVHVPEHGTLVETIAVRKHELCLTPWDSAPIDIPVANTCVVPVSPYHPVLRGAVVCIKPDNDDPQ